MAKTPEVILRAADAWSRSFGFQPHQRDKHINAIIEVVRVVIEDIRDFDDNSWNLNELWLEAYAHSIGIDLETEGGSDDA